MAAAWTWTLADVTRPVTTTPREHEERALLAGVLSAPFAPLHPRSAPFGKIPDYGRSPPLMAIWKRTVRLYPEFRDPALAFTARRDAIVTRLHASGWTTTNPNVGDLVDELATAEDGEEFDENTPGPPSTTRPTPTAPGSTRWDRSG